MLSTLLIFLTATPVIGEWNVPEQQEFILGTTPGLPKIIPTGDLPDKLEWICYSENGCTIPHEIVGKTFVLLAVKPGLYRIFTWKSGSPKETRQSVVIIKGGDVPEPVTPPGGVGPYPELVKAVKEGIQNATLPEDMKKADSITLFFFYGMLAERIGRDAEKQNPDLKTALDVGNLLKSFEKESLGGTQLAPLNTRYPLVSKAAADKFRVIFSTTEPNDPLSSDKRKIYSDFFKSMSLGAASSAWGK
jgi:hypothetical protein